MKIKLGEAITLFTIAKKVNLNKAKEAIDKVTLWILRLYPIVKEWDTLQADIQKEIEEIRKPFVEEMQKMSEEDRKSKEQEINKNFQEKINELPLVKAQDVKIKEEKEVDLPLFDKDEIKAIMKSFDKLEDCLPLLDYVEK